MGLGVWIRGVDEVHQGIEIVGPKDGEVLGLGLFEVSGFEDARKDGAGNGSSAAELFDPV